MVHKVWGRSDHPSGLSWIPVQILCNVWVAVRNYLSWLFVLAFWTLNLPGSRLVILISICNITSLMVGAEGLWTASCVVGFDTKCNVFGGLSHESSDTTNNRVGEFAAKPTTQLAVQRPSAPTISVVILQIRINLISLEPGRFSVQKARMNNQLR